MNPIILAVDTPDLTLAHSLIGKVRSHIGMIKIGTELWASHGPRALELGSQYGLPIFLDLKLHDIPNTVGKTVDVIAFKHCLNYDIRFLSVHAFGCKIMLKAAVSASRSSLMQIAAVTLLTSLDSRDLHSMGFTDGRENVKTVDLALEAWNSGVRTFICGPKNCKLMRKHLDDVGTGDKATLITPGIRNKDWEPDDQIRSATVDEAIRNGANWLVIGRPITDVADPSDAAKDLSNQAFKALDKWGMK